MIVGERAERAWSVFRQSEAHQLLLNHLTDRIANECKRLESIAESELLTVQTRVRELRKFVQTLNGKTPKWKENGNG